MRAFEDRFLTIGLPYRVIGGPRFYERMEIRDAMAYFRLSLSLNDDLAFERIVNTPKRGIGEKAQQKIQQMARDNRISLARGARLLLDAGGLSGKASIQLDLFLKNLDRWGALISREDVAHVELAGQILDESGYTEMWQNDKTPEAAGRLENLKELVKALEDFENLQGFLEHVSLIMENESVEFEQKVSLMTLHAAKGLEFPVVFLPGWEDGLFPSQRSMDESGVIGLEEERRLAYVGITRSEQACYISFAGNRRVFGQWQSSMPSRFIDELPEEHVEVLTASGIYSDTSDFNIHSSNLETDAFQADGYDSPGWRRLQNNKKQATLSKPAESRSILVNSNAKSIYKIGERVFHQKFGYGMVIEIEGDKLQIEFEKAGSKRVVSKFVSRPEDIT
jgi:DNA helicase-2/ATP-dependent DNA helicase PcrA